MFNITKEFLSILEMDIQVNKWVELLANGYFAEAASALAPTPCGRQMSEDDIRREIGLYSIDYVKAYEAGDSELQKLQPYITSPYLTFKGEKIVRYFWDDEHFTHILYNLPINGEWSDLSVEFIYYSLDSTTYYLGLERIFS